MVSKTNVKRYALIGLCVCSLILVFLPLFEIDAFFVDYSVSTWNIVRQAFGEDVDLEGGDLIAVICAIALMVIPLLHLLKLCGVFGKNVKSKRFISILLSVVQLLVILGFSYFLLFFENDLDDFEMNLLVSLLTPWFYIWFVIIVVMIVISFKLEPEKAIVCSNCGRTLTTADAFCPGCGTPRK